MSAQLVAGKGVDGDLGLLADRHVGDLCLLVIGDDPDIRHWAERRDLSARAHQLPRLYLALPDDPVLSRRNGGIAQIELGHHECRLGRGKLSLALLQLCLEHGQLALGSACLRPVLRQLRGQLRACGLQFLPGLDRRRPGLQESLLARDVAVVLSHHGAWWPQPPPARPGWSRAAAPAEPSGPRLARSQIQYSLAPARRPPGSRHRPAARSPGPCVPARNLEPAARAGSRRLWRIWASGQLASRHRSSSATRPHPPIGSSWSIR